MSPSRPSVVLDTTITIFMWKKAPALALYADDLRDADHFISFQTAAEMLRGAERGGWSASRRAKLDRFLQRFAKVPVDLELARTWAIVVAESSRQGRRLDTADAWVAATAIRRDVTLITHDPDFRDLAIPGLRVVCRAPTP